MISIYDPRVRAEALRYGITELQAYRNVNAAEAIQRSVRERRNIDAKAGRGIYK